MRKNQVLFYVTMLLLVFVQQPIQALNFTKAIQYESVNPLETHNEIIGTFVFEKLSSKQLLVTAKVEKRHFVYALKKEGKCEMKDMMRVCGNQYLMENFVVEINGREMMLNQENLNIEKDFVILTYTIDLLHPNIETIKIRSDYMFKYNDHAILKVVFDLIERTRSFNIKNRKRTIVAKF